MRSAFALRISSGKIIYSFGLPERQRTLRKPIFTGKIIAKPCFYNNHPRASCRVVLKYSLGVMPYSFLKARKKWL